jgi:hypothetical protein
MVAASSLCQNVTLILERLYSSAVRTNKKLVDSVLSILPTLTAGFLLFEYTFFFI